jgi:hypothetical protein
MHSSLEIRGDYVIWHRARQGARSARLGDRFDDLLAQKFAATEGSFGRDVYFAVPLRTRMRVYAVIAFLISLKFYVIRELVAGFVMVTAASAVIFVPLLAGFAVYKAGRSLTMRKGFRSVAMNMNKIIRFPGKDRQLEELLRRLAANQQKQVVLTLDPQTAATRNGLMLIRALPRRAS